MSIENIIGRRITGIRPFNELPIDAEIWREAHNNHTLHRQLHAAVVHRPGIVYGLEVVASKTRERTVVVAPGVGIDSEGRTIVVSEPVSFTLTETRQIYIILSYQSAADRDSAITLGGGQQYYREIESRDLIHVKELPKTPYLELARIFRSPDDKPIRDAANPFSPGNDELNLLFRPIAFPHCYADVGVGELPYVPKTSASPWNPNRSGLWNLLREGNGRGFHLQFTGPINLRTPSDNPPALLYMAGSQAFQPLQEAEIEGLRRYLEGGGLLCGEAKDEKDEFARGFQELASKLGGNLQPVRKEHPLLTAHYVFSSPPPGALGSGKLEADAEAGILFSTYNYGGAWQGDIDNPDAPDARERIRQAQEFGLNLIAYAARRERIRELSRLG
ncbi:MAG TPA: DUF4159 domain-containing protein [Chthonomonadaceae bacterium]|nr:DUF4159 domain-containing protein [Chthonomonadaceae bacterium]